MSAPGTGMFHEAPRLPSFGESGTERPLAPRIVSLSQNAGDGETHSNRGRRQVRLGGGHEHAQEPVPILHQRHGAGVGLDALRQIHPVDPKVEPGGRRLGVADAGRRGGPVRDVHVLGAGARVVFRSCRRYALCRHRIHARLEARKRGRRGDRRSYPFGPVTVTDAAMPGGRPEMVSVRLGSGSTVRDLRGGGRGTLRHRDGLKALGRLIALPIAAHRLGRDGIGARHEPGQRLRPLREMRIPAWAGHGHGGGRPGGQPHDGERQGAGARSARSLPPQAASRASMRGNQAASGEHACPSGRGDSRIATERQRSGDPRRHREARDQENRPRAAASS